MFGKKRGFGLGYFGVQHDRDFPLLSSPTFPHLSGSFNVFFLLDIILGTKPSLASDHPIFSSLAFFLIAHSVWSSVLLFVISLLMAMGWNNALSERGVFKNATIIPAFLFIILVNKKLIIWIIRNFIIRKF